MTTSPAPRAPDPSLEPSTGARPRGPDAWGETTLLAILTLFSVLPYANALLNGFVYDDTTQILDNPYILSFRYLGRIFSTPAWSYVGTHVITNYYRPMMTFVYLLCVQIFGPAPSGFHLANILFHASVVCLLYVLTRRMFSSRGIAFLAAALFALHPKHTEPVDWIAAVTDLEVTLFFLLTFWFFLRLPKQDGKWSGWAAFGMVAAFVLTILSKEQALMFPPLATLYEHFYRSDRGQTAWTQKVLRYSPFWVLSFAYLVFRSLAFGAFAPLVQHAEISQPEVFFSATSLAGQYILEVFRPFHLSAFYPFHPVSSLWSPSLLGSVTAILACAGLFVLAWRRERVLSFGFIWFFLTLAPVLNVRVLASDNVFAERYLYLPSVGFCWLTGYVLMRLWERLSSWGKFAPRAYAGGLLVVAVSFAAQIVVRNRVWRNEMVLDTATLVDAPNATPLYNNLASAYWDQGDVDTAERLWRRALETAPNSSTIVNNLGLAAMKRGDMPQAVACFRKSIQLQPNLPDAHLNLGYTYQEMGEKEQAETEYREARRLAPLNLHVRNRLGELYREEGRTEEALEQFGASASIAPNVVAYDALGKIWLDRNLPSKAEEMFQRALDLNGADIGARRELANIYAASGRVAQAREYYQEILKLNPNDTAARAALQNLSGGPSN